MKYPAYEVQFHMYRIGSRVNVAKLYRRDPTRFLKLHPRSDIDRYLNGSVIPLGSFYIKKCCRCQTAREVERFTESGSICDACRPTRKREFT